MFSRLELHEAMDMHPGDAWSTKPITPKEMRIGLAQASRYNVMVRRVEELAHREGWGGEDKYTALAFYLCLQNEVHVDNANRRLDLEVRPPFFIKESDLKRIGGHPTACDPPFFVTNVKPQGG
jgi:hypothetical protein